MDARHYNGQPDDRDEQDREYASITHAERHEMNCYVLTTTVTMAADPAVPAFSPYKGDLVQLAVWWTKETVRHARTLGLLPGQARMVA